VTLTRVTSERVVQVSSVQFVLWTGLNIQKVNNRVKKVSYSLKFRFAFSRTCVCDEFCFRLWFFLTFDRKLWSMTRSPVPLKSWSWQCQVLKSYSFKSTVTVQKHTNSRPWPLNMHQTQRWNCTARSLVKTGIWLEVGTGVYNMPVSDTTYDDSTDYYLLLITCVI